MSSDGFIFLLGLGSTLLIGILAVAHISAYRLARRREARQQAAAAREPQFEFGDLAPGSDVVGGITASSIRAKVGHVA